MRPPHVFVLSDPDDAGLHCLDCYLVGQIVVMVLGPPTLVATIAYAVRLGLHAKRRPRTHVSFAPGALLWRF